MEANGQTTSNETEKPSSTEWMVRGIAATGGAAGLGALAASSCCLVPTVLGWLGLGAGALSLSLLGAVEFLGQWRAHLLLASAIFVFGGWTVWLRQRRAAHAFCPSPRMTRISTATMASLVIATLCLAGAIGWEYVESLLMAAKPA